ncbi:MAG: hypothetical protein ACF8QF_06535, partial [Phycisphaerales bacterium]
LVGVVAAPAAAQDGATGERIVIQPAGRATWAQMVATEMIDQRDLIKLPEVVHSPTKLDKSERPLDAERIDAEVQPDDAPAAAVRSLRSLDDLALQNGFLGMADNNTSIPPDTMGAVGPNHLMTMLNTQVGIQNKQGGQFSIVSLDTFWTVGTGISGDPFDPVLLYDALSGRWIACADADSRSASSSVFFAISDGADPTQGWTFYEIDADPTNVSWADFPGFGVNSTWIAITNNMFTVAGNGFSGVKMWVIDKSTALAGGALTITTFNQGFDLAGNLDGFTMRPAQTFDAAESNLYIIDNSGFSSGGIPLLRLSRITGTGPAPVWNALPGIFGGVNAGSGLYSVVNDFSLGFPDASQLGSGVRVQTNDYRIINAVVRNGRLWCTHAAGLPESGADRTAAFWYEWNPTNGALQQSGVISGGADTHHFFPSLSVNSANDMVIGFSRSDAGRFVEAAYTGRLAGDVFGTTRPITVMKVGEDVYEKSFGSGQVRWGDYSATGVDPVDDLTFWSLQQYAETDVGASQSNDRWGAWWSEIGSASLCPTDLTGDGQTDGADLGVLLGAWGTNQYDFNGDGTIDGADLGIMLGSWGPCP